jgi:tRNA(His) guanylyltransferase
MKDDLGDRIKNNLENRMRHYLLRRMPVIIRLDGKAFSRWTKRFKKPYDPLLHAIFNDATKTLCQEVSGTILAEHHSDEVSLLLVDYQQLTTEAYFDYNQSKVESVVAGLFTAEFCRLCVRSGVIDSDERWPSFDCWSFNIPESEVANYLWWRNRDAVRNSISMWAQSKFSHKELHGINTSQMQEMLFQKHGINWNDLEQYKKSGWLFTKQVISGSDRTSWFSCSAPHDHTEHEAFMATIPYRMS